MNYLLTGPEGYLKHQFIEKLKKSVLSRGTEELDFDAFNSGQSEITEILNSFNTLPFVSKHRIAVIRDVEKFSPKEKDLILKYLESPSTSTTLVLISSSPESNRLLQEISKFAKVIKCNRLRARDLNLWVKSEFAIHKKKISFSLANLIIDLVGDDLFLLKNEIEKLISFVADSGEVTEREIEAVLAKVTYKTVFKLVDLVLENKIDKALEAMDDILTKEKPHQILNLLAWQFRNFIKIKNLPKNISPDLASSLLNINWNMAKRLLERVNYFTIRDLKKNLEILLEADFFIKRGLLDGRHALERALVLLR